MVEYVFHVGTGFGLYMAVKVLVRHFEQRRRVNAALLAWINAGLHTNHLPMPYAKGGYVPAPPNTTTTIPAFLTTGTYVVNAKDAQTAAYAVLKRLKEEKP